MSEEGYVNEGTDARARGIIGKLLAGIQRGESFKSPYPPELVWHKVHRPFLWFQKLELWEYRSVPGNKPFRMAFYYRRDGLIDTYRIGHRYDNHWGGPGTEGFNPDPAVVGGYIYDVIIKLSRTPEDAATYII